ncbi:hypothetical protein PG993_000446 [Apiospora rasikravindrae]|uniref:ribonuclease H n=1 Tax=Apiospora rasikravindrae TaxID=990691 RepID=A0ABR1UBE2_9PEZI
MSYHRPLKRKRGVREYKKETHGPHPGGAPESTCETYPREDEYAEVPGGKPTDPLDLEMDGINGFMHVRCPRGKTKCPCGRLALHIDSLVIAIDGACPGNGSLNATRSGGGIFFGTSFGANSPTTDYKQNFAFRIPDHSYYPHTSQRAELHAAAGALLKARHYVNEGGQFPCEGCVRPCTVKHIVLKTDSAYLVKGITSHINKWRHNGWRTADRREVKNRDLWEWLDRLINAYDDMDVVVDFWLVRREHNVQADALAAIDSAMSLTLTIEGGFKNGFF